MSVEIDVKTALEKFRMFMILNTCHSFIPKGYLKDPSIFPERDPPGRIHVEALSKLNLETVREIRFVRAYEVLGIIYNSKSGNTNLIWRQVKGVIGRASGKASPNSIVNLVEAEVLPKSYVKRFLKELEAKGGSEGAFCAHG
jgi:hypothetical protein